MLFFSEFGETKSSLVFVKTSTCGEQSIYPLYVRLPLFATVGMCSMNICNNRVVQQYSYSSAQHHTVHHVDRQQEHTQPIDNRHMYNNSGGHMYRTIDARQIRGRPSPIIDLRQKLQAFPVAMSLYIRGTFSNSSMSYEERLIYPLLYVLFTLFCYVQHDEQ